jgi:hypothetical protein
VKDSYICCITGVNNTSDACVIDVIDTSKAGIHGVNNTGKVREEFSFITGNACITGISDNGKACIAGEVCSDTN